MKRISCLLPSLIMLLALMNGCTKNETCPPEEDETSPRVIIVSPLNNSSVSDTTIVRALATDEKGIKKVTLYLDGLPMDNAEDESEPYEFQWITFLNKDSSTHVITARAFDKSGNPADSDPVICTIDNSAFYPERIDLYEIIFDDGSFMISWPPYKGKYFSKYTLYESYSESMSGKEEIYSSGAILDTSYRVSDVNLGEIRFYQLMVTNGMHLSTCGDITPAFSSYPSPEGLVAYYPFNGNALDESGHAHDGLVMGAELTDDKDGNPSSAFEFGEGDYIEVTNHDDIFFPDGYTLAAWVYPTGTSDHCNIISKVNPNRDFVMQLSTNNLLNAHYVPSGAYYCLIFSDEPVPLFKWTHVACVYHASGLKLYINGKLVKESTYGNDIPPWTGTIMLIGAMNYGENFLGKIDEVMVFGRALPDEEVEMLYH